MKKSSSSRGIYDIVLKADPGTWSVARGAGVHGFALQPVRDEDQSLLLTIPGEPEEAEARRLALEGSWQGPSVELLHRGRGSSRYIVQDHEEFSRLFEAADTQLKDLSLVGPVLAYWGRLYLRGLQHGSVELPSSQGDFQVERVSAYQPKWATMDFLYGGLSRTEIETARAAFEAGYYEVPRLCTMDEISSHLGISKTTVHNRLRRVHATAIELLLDRLSR